jgi:hypothetical protein
MSESGAMQTPLLSRRAGFRALGIVIALGAVTLIARPTAGRPVPPVAPAAAAIPQGGIIVQVRDFPSSPTVLIVAWNATQPGFGLSYAVRRSGAPERYHRLWVNLEWPGGRDASDAKGFDRPLQVSQLTEAQPCFEGKCLPPATFGARIPDAAVRAAKGNAEVKFVTSSGSEINFTVRRDLMDAYLRTVDSVVTAFKK